MKIAFLNKYQNKVNRGAETFVYELSRRLSKNHQVDVVSDINYWRILKSKYDVIIPTNGRLQVVICRKIAWFTGTKLVVSGQSGMGWDDKLNLLSFPNAFVALSSKAFDWAKKFNPYVRVEKIPNGVDLDNFNLKGVSINTGLKSPVILSVGAFTDQKRLDLVVNAVAKLENASLMLVGGGGGDKKTELEKLGTKMLGNRFKILTLPFSDMPKIYRSADVFTLPSYSSESFGNVLVEAMACGLPVVATDDLVRREIVGDAGFFVDPTNSDEYAKVLSMALKTNWGNKPRLQAEKFSWDKIAEEYEALLKTL